jgi:hypothetical protein
VVPLYDRHMTDSDDISQSELDRLGRQAVAEGERRKREDTAVDDLEQFFVPWDGITTDLVAQFRDEVDRATDELVLQRFLSSHRELLVQSLGGGHGRWVIPHKAFGRHYESDFMIAEKSSVGFEWTAVELEGPQRAMFNKDGTANQYLNKGIQQIQDWRRYIRENLDHCRKPTHLMGLGMVDIDDSLPGWVIIGRRAQLDPATNARRRQLAFTNNVRIHTYDWLIDAAERRCDELDRWRTRQT